MNMKDNDWGQLTSILQDIPLGTCRVIPHYPKYTDHGAMNHFTAMELEGCGLVEDYHLLPGMHMAYYRIISNNFIPQHISSDTVLEINHCRRGRAGWKLADNHAVYLAQGIWSCILPIAAQNPSWNFRWVTMRESPLRWT